MPALSTLYTEATWSTDRYFSKKVTDNFFSSNPVTYMLRRNARTIPGGESLEISMIFDDADGEWFSEWDTYSAVHKEQLSAARLDWKLYTVPVVMSNKQLLKNGDSPERRYDLAMNKNIVAAKSAANDFGTALFADDTTFLAGSMEAIDPIDLAVGTGAYAGITRTSGAGTVFAGTEDTTTTVLTLSAIQSNFGTASQGGERPNLIVTTQANYNRIFDLYTPIQRIGSEELGKAGFTSLVFNMAPVVVDSHVAAGYLYGLNMNHIELVAHRDAFFSFEKYVVPSNQWVSIGRYFFMGNVLCHAPRYQFKMSAITA
jgi:hypothetical protein